MTGTKLTYPIFLVFVLGFVLMPVSNAAQWNIDIQGDENHNNTYGQTDPVDYTEPGVYWNIFEVPALSAPWPGPTNYTTNPSMDLADDEGNFGVGKFSLVKFSIVGDAYGWAGDAGDHPLTGDYLIILNDFGVTNDPLTWRIIGLAPSTTYRLTYYHRANVLARGINFVANGVETTVSVPGSSVASALVTTDWGGRITGTADSHGYYEGDWSALTIGTVAATATNPHPADGATNVPTDVVLSWQAGTTAASHDVYFGASSPPAFIGNLAASSYDPGTLEPDTTYYWKIDEVEADGTTIHTGDVWSFTTQHIVVPVPLRCEASNPDPADGATKVPLDVVLSWTPGGIWPFEGTRLQDVYFGTNFGDVNNADTKTAGVYKGRQPLKNTSYDPGGLGSSKEYYWRIDMVNVIGWVATVLCKGDLWSFTTVGQPAVGDYGDAPEPSFPSRFSSRGPCHLDVTQEWIGGPISVTSVEFDAIEPDGDADDKRAWWWFPPFDPAGYFVTQVSYDTANSSPDDPRYLNVLVDLDNSGTWDSGDEWPVRNFRVPFEDLPQDVGTMYVSALLPESIVPGDLPDKWTRVTLSERVVPDGFGAWGVFKRGETEDFENKEDFQSKLDAPPSKFQVAFLNSPKASENFGYPWAVCAHEFGGKEVPVCPDKGRPYRWKIWIPKLDPDRWYNARILIRRDGIVLFYLDGILVYMSTHRITPAYEGQAAVEIGNGKSLYDNVLVAEPGLHVNEDPVFFKEDFSGALLQWNLWDAHTPPDIETINSDGTPPPCLFLGDNDYAVSDKTFSYVDKSIEFSANIRQADAGQSFACLHVSKRKFYVPGDDYFARIKVTGSSHPNPNTVYCELLYKDNGEEKWEKSDPLPIPILEVKQVLVRFAQNPNHWCPGPPCSRLSPGDCVLARRLAGGGKGSEIAKLNGPWVKLLEPDALGRPRPKFGLNFGSNVVDGYLCFPDAPGQDSVKVEVKTIYDPVGDFVCRYDYSESMPVAIIEVPEEIKVLGNVQ